MKTFTDTTGRVWTVSVTVDTVKRVRDLAKVDLMEILGGKLVERLISDPVLLCDVLYAACRPEADARQVDDRAFGASLGGDAIEHATTALLEELVGFFPSGRRRLLVKAMEKMKTVEHMALTMAEGRLDSPEFDRRVAELLKQAAPDPLPPTSGS